MIALFDSDGVLTTLVPDYHSAIETERWTEYGSITGKLDASNYAAFDAARYVAVAGTNPRVYLIEKTSVSGDGSMTFEGRDATCELDHRTVPYTKRITAKPWGVLNTLMASFTSSRSITPQIGADPNLGSSVRVQITWGQCGERIREVLEAQGLSIESVWNNSGIYLNILAPVYNGRHIGDRYRNADLTDYTVDESAWYTYAYVAGQGEGAAREVVQLDLTGGGERRELYVDADDIAKDDLTTSEYRELLATRGEEKLAEHRRVDVITAESSVPFLGEVVRYDSRVVSAWLMCTEREIVREGGTETVRATLGEPTPTLRKAIRRAI